MLSSNIIVASHRRSGTHFTIDTIFNNFKNSYANKYINLDRIEVGHDKPSSKEVHEPPLKINQFIDIVSSESKIIKTHFLPSSLAKLHLQSEEEIKFINNLFTNTKIIYVYRNGIEVMSSLYIYMKYFNKEVNNMPFERFLQSTNDFDDNNLNRLQYWKLHITEWQSFSKNNSNVLLLKYEDLLNQNIHVVKLISKFIGVDFPEEPIDVKYSTTKNPYLKLYHKALQKLNIGSVKRTTITPGLKFKDNVELFNKRARRIFLDEIGDFNNSLGFINDFN